jgi:hypothetical protein
MTAPRSAGTAARALSVLVLAASGAYMLVYLYRWEWNRALIAGVVFVSVEVALGVSLILGRLHRLDEQLAARNPAETGAPSPRAVLAATPIEHPDPFSWLRPRPDRLGVFIPVLLGAGAVLSAAAYVVERVGSATAGPVLDRRLARRLDALAPPGGGLTATGAASPIPPPRRPRSRARGAVALAIAVPLVAGAVLVLREATESRPSQGPRPERTMIELMIEHRDGEADTQRSAEALWASCRWTVRAEEPLDARLATGSDGRVHLLLRPGLGELAARQLVGCLTDLQLDLVQARVVSGD